MVPLATKTGALPSGPPPYGRVVFLRAVRNMRPAGPRVRRVSLMMWRKGRREFSVEMEKEEEEGFSSSSKGTEKAD